MFTSANGVDGFFARGLVERGLDTRALGTVRVAAIGPGTAAALAAATASRPTSSPSGSSRESLLEAFPPALTGDRVLLARAEQARDVLPEGLERLGYAVEVLPVYRTVTAEPDPGDLARVRDGAVDAITFTSSSTVTNFCDLVGPLPDPAPAVVSIGPVTSDTARAGASRSTAEADPHTIEGLVTAVVTTLVPPLVEPDLDLDPDR